MKLQISVSAAKPSTAVKRSIGKIETSLGGLQKNIDKLIAAEAEGKSTVAIVRSLVSAAQKIADAATNIGIELSPVIVGDLAKKYPDVTGVTGVQNAPVVRPSSASPDSVESGVRALIKELKTLLPAPLAAKVKGEPYGVNHGNLGRVVMTVAGGKKIVVTKSADKYSAGPAAGEFMGKGVANVTAKALVTYLTKTAAEYATSDAADEKLVAQAKEAIAEIGYKVRGGDISKYTDKVVVSFDYGKARREYFPGGSRLVKDHYTLICNKGKWSVAGKLIRGSGTIATGATAKAAIKAFAAKM